MMTDDERRELEQLRAEERRLDTIYTWVLIGGLMAVIFVVVLVLG